MKRFVLSVISLSLMLSSMPPMKVFGNTADMVNEQEMHSCEAHAGETHDKFNVLGGDIEERNEGVVSYGIVNSYGLVDEYLNPPTQEVNAPEIHANDVYFDTVDKVTIEDITNGVSVTNSTGTDITDKLTYETDFIKGNTGEYYVRFSATDDNGKTGTKTIKATVGNDITYASDLKYKDEQIGHEKSKRDKATTGGDMYIMGKDNEFVPYKKGIGAHATSVITIDIPEGAKYFISDIGSNISGNGYTSMVFEVYLDDIRQYKSQIVRRNTPAERVIVPLGDAKEIKLRVDHSINWKYHDHANWGNARFSSISEKEANKSSLKNSVKIASELNELRYKEHEIKNIETALELGKYMLKNDFSSQEEVDNANRMVNNAIDKLPLSPLDVFTDTSYSILKPEYNHPLTIQKIIEDSKDDGIYNKYKGFLEDASAIANNKDAFKDETFTLTTNGKDNAREKDFAFELTQAQTTGLYIIPGQTVRFYLDSDKPLKVILPKSPSARYISTIAIMPGINEYTLPNDSVLVAINLSNQYTKEEQPVAPKLRIEGATKFPVYTRGKTDMQEMKKDLEKYLENTSFSPTDEPFKDGVSKTGEYANMAQIETDNIVISTSAAGFYKELLAIEESGKTIDYYLEEWDRMINLYYQYAGYSLKPEDKGTFNYRPNGRIIMQIGGRGGGGPFGTAGDYFAAARTDDEPNRENNLFSSIIRESYRSNWLIWHEIAHVFENRPFMKMEMTTNLLTLAAQDKILGPENNRLATSGNWDTLNNYHVSGELDPDNIFNQLSILYQLHGYLGYDWYGNIAKNLRANDDLLEGVTDLFGKYTVGIAKTYDVDVSSHFEHYGLEVSKKAKEIASKYPKLDKKVYLTDGSVLSPDSNSFAPNAELTVNISPTNDGKTKLEMNMVRPEDSLLAYEIYKDNKLIGVTKEDTFIDNNPSNNNYYVIAVDRKYNEVKSKIVGRSIYLSDLQEKSASVGWGEFRKDTAPNGSPITLINMYGENETFEKGLGAHTQSEIVYDIEGKGYDKFLAKVGVDRSMKHSPYDESIVSFEVFVDGKMKYYSGRMSVRQRYDEVDIDISGAKEITLVTNSIGSNWYDQTVWADAKFIEDTTPKEAEVFVDKNVVMEKGELYDLLEFIDIKEDEDAVATSIIRDDSNVNVDEVGSYTGKVTVTTAGIEKSVDVPITVVDKKTYLSDLQEKSASVGWGNFEKDKAPNGTKINLLKESGEEVEFSKGLGTHTQSEIIYDIAGKGYDTFFAKAGVDRDYKNAPKDESIVSFDVYVDDKLEYTSGQTDVRQAYKDVKVKIGKDAKEIKLVTNSLGLNWSDQTIWADAFFTSSKSQADVYIDDIVIELGDKLDLEEYIHAKDKQGNALKDITIDTTNIDTFSVGDYTATATVRENSGVEKVVDVPVSVVAKKLYLSDLQEKSASVGWGNFEKDKAVDGSKIDLLKSNGEEITFEKGLGTHAPATIVYDVKDKGYNTFLAKVGIDRGFKNAGAGITTVSFKVYVDDNLRYDSGRTDVWQPLKEVEVNVTDAHTVKLVVDSLGSNAADHAVWADAMFTMNDNPLEVFVDKDITITKGEELDLSKYVHAEYKSGDKPKGIIFDKSGVNTNEVGVHYAMATIPYGRTQRVVEMPINVVARKDYLSNLQEKSAKVDWGKFEKDKAVDGSKIDLLKSNGEEITFEKGLGTHAPATIVYDVKDKGYNTFLAKVGIDRGFKNAPAGVTAVSFKVYVDNDLKYDSGRTDVWQPLKEVRVNVTDAHTVKLVVDSLGSNAADHAVWADAMFTSNTQAPERTRFSLNELPEVNDNIEEITPEINNNIEEVTPEINNNIEEVTPEINNNIEEVTPEINNNIEEVTPEINDNTEEVTPEINDNTEEVTPEINDNTEEVTPEINDNTEEVTPEINDNTEEIIGII